MRRLRLRPALGAGLLGHARPGRRRVRVRPRDHRQGTNGTFDVTVTKWPANARRDSIHIRYTPDTSKVNCSPIYLVQTVPRSWTTNGGVIKPKDYKTTAFVHLQDDMTAGGHVRGPRRVREGPLLQRRGRGQGHDERRLLRRAHVATGTTMYDAPRVAAGALPGRGDHDHLHVRGVRGLQGGRQDPRLRDLDLDAQQDRTGQGHDRRARAAAQPSHEFKDALAGYESNHENGTVCPELLAETNLGGKNVEPGANKKSPFDPPAEGQPSIVQWSIVNTGGQDVLNVTWTVMLDGMFLTWGVVPLIGWFDFATVDFPLPPLPAGIHTLTLLVDSDYLIPEYDEADNFAMDEFEVRPAVGVGPVRPRWTSSWSGRHRGRPGPVRP